MLWIAIAAGIVAVVCFIRSAYFEYERDKLALERTRWSVHADQFGFTVSLFLNIPRDDTTVEGWYSKLEPMFEELSGQEVAFAERKEWMLPTAQELRRERFILRMVRERVNYLLDNELSVYSRLPESPEQGDEVLLRVHPRAEEQVSPSLD